MHFLAVLIVTLSVTIFSPSLDRYFLNDHLLAVLIVASCLVILFSVMVLTDLHCLEYRSYLHKSSVSQVLLLAHTTFSLQLSATRVSPPVKPFFTSFHSL